MTPWGRTKPPPGTMLDRASPLCGGLTAFWAVNEGAGGRLNDSAGQTGPLLSQSAAGRVWTDGGYQTLAAGGQSAHGSVAMRSRGGITWALYLKNPDRSQSNKYACLWGPGSGSGAFGVLYGYVSGVYEAYWNNDAGGPRFACSPAVTSGADRDYHLVVATCQTGSGGRYAGYYDGALVSSGTTGLAVPTTATTVRLGQADAGGDLSATWGYWAWWDRALSAGEVASLWANPYGMFATPPLRRTWMAVGAAAVPPPVAAFSGTPLSGTAPLSVAFTDASTNSPTSWLWEKNPGDGWVNFAGTPTAQNPTEEFAAGTWSVRLTATNAGGSDAETKTDYVTATAPSSSTPAPRGTALAGLSAFR